MPRRSASLKSVTVLFVSAVAVAAGGRVLGDQGARIGSFAVPPISPWWVFLSIAVAFLLAPRRLLSLGAKTTLVLAVLLGATYWPLHSWHLEITRPPLLPATVDRVSRPSHRPRTVFLSSLRLPSRRYLHRVAGRRRDVLLEGAGYLRVPQTGEYRFLLAADDRGRLEIDGTMVLDHRGIGARTMSLTAGTHTFRLRYEQIGGPAHLDLGWDRPGFIELLPLEYWLSSEPFPAADGSFRSRENQAATTFLLMVFWWTLAGCLTVDAGVRLRGWMRRAPRLALSGGARPWRRVVLFLAAQLALLAVLVVAAELALSRFVDVPSDLTTRHFRLNHTRPPNRTLIDDAVARKDPDFSQPYTHHYNAQAWVETYDVSKQKPPHTYRIFYVGDSFTEGAVPTPLTVPDQVEGYLNDAYGGSGTRFEVINTGTMSYSPIIYYILIRYYLLEYSPDLIVLNVDMTDCFDDWVYRQSLITDRNGDPWAVPPSSVYTRVYIETEQGLMRATLMSKLTLFLYENSHIYNFILEKIPVSETRRSRLAKLAAAQSDELRSQGIPARWGWCQYEWDDQTAENVDYTMKTVEKIANLCSENGVRLLITGVPHYRQYAAGSDGRPEWSHRPHQEMEKVARRTGVAYLDSYHGLASLIEGSPQNEYYYRNDMHFNPKGYRAWGRLHIEALTDPGRRLLPEAVVGPGY